MASITTGTTNPTTVIISGDTSSPASTPVFIVEQIDGAATPGISDVVILGQFEPIPTTRSLSE